MLQAKHLAALKEELVQRSIARNKNDLRVIRKIDQQLHELDQHEEQNLSNKKPYSRLKTLCVGIVVGAVLVGTGIAVGYYTDRLK